MLKFEKKIRRQKVKVHIFEYLRYVVRINDKRRVKKVLKGKPGGGRKKGRIRLRWLDDIESDLRNMGVKRRTRALERTAWPSLVREAKATIKGLHC